MTAFSTVPIIQQIKANTKLLKLVGGAAEIARFLDTENITPQMMPFCGVIYSDSQCSENDGLNTVWQVENIQFDCVIILDNTTNQIDTAGQAAAIEFFDVKTDVNKCILNWVPPFNAQTPISFVGGGLEELTMSRATYKLTFKCNINISADDGYLSPTYSPWQFDSVEVDATPSDSPTSHITGSFTIP
ncbi:phage tail terminator protein [Gluconacetobacter diazotrophicus]|uniref:phage tail terminator protein n=1 Tax=Gluconacetobacter diazotrophicus TaxID=33996 RepID=UPI00119E06CF|nr:hypothetical protein [Gluconacetobacter diazotrophicus]